MRDGHGRHGRSNDLYGIVFSSAAQSEHEMENVLWWDCIRPVLRCRRIDTGLRGSLAGGGYHGALCVVVRYDAPLVPVALATVSCCSAMSARGISDCSIRVSDNESAAIASPSVLSVCVLKPPFEVILFGRCSPDEVEPAPRRAQLSRPISFSLRRSGVGLGLFSCRAEGSRTLEIDHWAESWVLLRVRRSMGALTERVARVAESGPFAAPARSLFSDLAESMIKAGRSEIHAAVAPAA